LVEEILHDHSSYSYSVILNPAEVDLEEAEVGASRAPIVKLMIHVSEKMMEYL
jgi:hypothetical protein